MEPEVLPYYHELNEEQANAILKHGPIGAYLLRQSSDSEAVCTLSVRGRFEIFNIRVYLSNDGARCFLQSSEEPKRYFADLGSLIEYYIGKNLPGRTGCKEKTFKLVSPMLKARNSLDAWL